MDGNAGSPGPHFSAMSKFKTTIIKLHWFLSSQFGIDPQRFLRSLRGLPAYLADWFHFRKNFAGKMKIMPCLHDRYEEGGATKSEYFWQDLLVARAIHEAKPAKHVDVGSRVDGFIAHVASFREIEVFDVRPISTVVPGVVFRQADWNSKYGPFTAVWRYVLPCYTHRKRAGGIQWGLGV